MGLCSCRTLGSAGLPNSSEGEERARVLTGKRARTWWDDGLSMKRRHLLGRRERPRARRERRSDHPLCKTGTVKKQNRMVKSNKPIPFENMVWAYWLLLDMVWATHIPIEEHGAAEYDTAIGLTCLCSERLHNRLHQTTDSSRTENAKTTALVLQQAPDDK